jgi:hypothetical protein
MSAVNRAGRAALKEGAVGAVGVQSPQERQSHKEDVTSWRPRKEQEVTNRYGIWDKQPLGRRNVTDLLKPTLR